MNSLSYRLQGGFSRQGESRCMRILISVILFAMGLFLGYLAFGNSHFRGSVMVDVLFVLTAFGFLSIFVSVMAKRLSATNDSDRHQPSGKANGMRRTFRDPRG